MCFHWHRENNSEVFVGIILESGSEFLIKDFRVEVSQSWCSFWIHYYSVLFCQLVVGVLSAETAG